PAMTSAARRRRRCPGCSRRSETRLPCRETAAGGIFQAGRRENRQSHARERDARSPKRPSALRSPCPRPLAAPPRPPAARPGEPASPTGWGGRIRTFEYGFQRPAPYRLATPQEVVTKGEV